VYNFKPFNSFQQPSSESFRIGIKLRMYLKLINPFISNGLISKQPPTGLKAAVGVTTNTFKKGRQTLFRFIGIENPACLPTGRPVSGLVKRLASIGFTTIILKINLMPMRKLSGQLSTFLH
jgi:hypothetical protein